ncbi:hypothetical protein [Lentilitoribacter sp. Alg239-R112]|uniref:hypothetical protein n=1 Tax=Lentilitoribacter sp. Alg239-R112 TaxID=2305987 RepID=UPI0013A6E6E3|nr:hypothetical protein [Lentilitoribacter sp. Alg239-R112]
MSDFEYNLVKWGMLVVVCAMPSFVLVIGTHDVLALLAGILTLILFYAFLTSTSYFIYYLDSRPFLKRLLYFAYVFKIFVALIWTLAYFLADKSILVLILPDLYAGAVAKIGVLVALSVSEAEIHNFVPTYLMTVVEGIIVSVTVLLSALTMSIPIGLYKKFRE